MKCVNIMDILKEKPGFRMLTRASEIDILDAEAQLNLKFSDDYYNYLLNCGVATFQGHELTGICESKRLSVISATILARNCIKNYPDDFYVIEETGIDGIVICQIASGDVYSIANSTVPRKIAENFANYLSNL